MKFFDQEALLTTKNGMQIPSVFFDDPLEKTAFAMIRQVQKKIILYADNPFYADTVHTLYDHIDQLMETFLTLPSVQNVLQGGRAKHPKLFDIVVKAGRQLLIHDNGEVYGEGLSFHQKTIYPHLIAATKKFEPVAALSSYCIALCCAAKGKPEEFFKLTKPIQVLLGKNLANLKKYNGDEAFYTKTLGKITQLINDQTVDAFNKGLTPKVKQQVYKLYQRYEREYNECETSGAENSISAMIVKALDKNVYEYLLSSEMVYQNPGMKSSKLNREPNHLVCKTYERSEKPIIALQQLTETNPLADAFYKDLSDLYYQRNVLYALLGRDYIFLDGAAPPEVGIKEDPQESLAIQKDIHEQYIAAGIHPLDNPHIISDLEMTAKIITLEEMRPPLIKSILDCTTINHAGFREQYDQNLASLQKLRPAEKHQILVLS